MGAFVGQARFDGCIAANAWPRHEVEALLPPGVELDGDDAATHPVVIIFGEQTDTAVLFAGLTLPSAARYHELAFSVPFVRLRAGRGLYTYIPKMYASYFPAVLSGNLYYGFSKELARLGWEAREFVVKSTSGTPLLRIEVDRVGDWEPSPAAALAGFEAIRRMFELPVIGCTESGLVRSRFEWDFRASELRAIHARLSLRAQLLPGLTARRGEGSQPGSFEVRSMTWRIGWPAAL
jgi:hypothetical protein